MGNFNELSFQFVMELYRTKMRAIESNDADMLLYLEQEYPELFTNEFEDFVSNLKMSIEDLRHSHGEDFSNIIKHKIKLENKVIH